MNSMRNQARRQIFEHEMEMEMEMEMEEDIFLM